ncbi:MAG: site-specific integrase [Eubacterium sp.]|nr:site-specific integrase [Eubacterium sp.]
MGIYMDEKTEKWRVVYSYTDWSGVRRQTSKRGFRTKREARKWEQEAKLRMEASLNMTFQSFIELYEADRRPRVKASTWMIKDNIMRSKILPFFRNYRMSDIQAKDVINWQNGLMARGEAYTPDYLRSIHAELSATFNHAVRYYGLPKNPARYVGAPHKGARHEMQFWTRDEYLRFAEEMKSRGMYFYIFEMLYWTGMRAGELLALTAGDIDLDEGTVKISKTYHRMAGRDVITSPKTPKSNRTVTMPVFLCDEMRTYMRSKRGRRSGRLFPVSKYHITHEMKLGCERAGVKVIRVHDLRHSHVSLLINMGFSALAIGERVGHEAEKITYRYAHLFPTVQTEMAARLEVARDQEISNKNDSDGIRNGV